MVVSPNLSNLASTDFAVIAMVPFTLPAASATFLRSVSFFECTFSASFSGGNPKISSCVFMLLTESLASASFLACALILGGVHPGGLEPDPSFMLLAVFPGKVLPNGWLYLGVGASGLASDDSYLGWLDSDGW